jgi:DNA-binding transcriptional ArsR family regulator
VTDRIDAVFSALSDPTRREVMRVVSEQGGASASELAEQIPVSRQAIAKHLSVLAEAGLVKADRDGRQMLYKPTPRPLNEAMSWIADVGAEWDERLQALEAFLRRRHRRRR